MLHSGGNMKLYATITSERASKGQGGDYLDIIITDAEKNELWYINVIWGIDKLMQNAHLIMVHNNKKEIFRNNVSTTDYLKTKGKKQKDELCNICRTGHNGEKCQGNCSCTLCNR